MTDNYSGVDDDRNFINEEDVDDVDDDDIDSTYSETYGSSAECPSEVFRHHFEYGRRYHGFKRGEYLAPNDEEEQDRMDMEHHIHLAREEDRLHISPLDNPARVLDVGTGTGIWVIEMSEQYPSCTVEGTDLSPIQPNWVPPNCHFYIDDINSEASEFSSVPYDFIYARSLQGCVSSYQAFVRKAYNSLRPGGRLEVVDLEPYILSQSQHREKSSISATWNSEIEAAFAKFGKPLFTSELCKRTMEMQGFEDIQLQVSQRPTTTWPKDPRFRRVGMMSRAILWDGLLAFSLAPLIRMLRYTPDEVMVLVAKVVKQATSPDFQGYQKQFVCCGCRPLF